MKKRESIRAQGDFSALRIFACALLTASMLSSAATSAKEKMKSEEIVAKHLESIGSTEGRASVRSRIILGTSSVTFRGRTTGAVDGQAVLASENRRNLVVMKFVSPNYPHERMGFDGESLTVGYERPGGRSVLGNFLLMHDTIFKHGLMGGTLSSAWPLLDLATRDVKLEYDGMGKVNDRQCYKVRYSPRKGSDLQTTLFFDTENFQHLRTQYERVIAPQQGTSIDNSVRQSETRYKMIEEFSDFRNEGGLNLPHVYNLKLNIENNSGSRMQDWVMNLRQFNFNRPIDVKSFNIDTY